VWQLQLSFSLPRLSLVLATHYSPSTGNGAAKDPQGTSKSTARKTNIMASYTPSLQNIGRTALAATLTCGLMAGMSNKASAEPVAVGAIAVAAVSTVVGVVVDDLNDRNREIAARQNNGTDRAVARTTGISMNAIREHGVAGGPNSEVRKMGRRLRRMFR